MEKSAEFTEIFDANYPKNQSVKNSQFRGNFLGKFDLPEFRGSVSA